MPLLNKGNSKTVKGEKLGYRTYGLHLAPYNLSGRNICPHASKGCAESCLNAWNEALEQPSYLGTTTLLLSPVL